MGRMIGSGSLWDGLYYLDSQPQTPDRLKQAYHIVHSDDYCKEMALALETEAAFLLLQRMFLSSFLHKNIFKFKCETCELAKHHWLSFPLSLNKSYEAFVIVHTDI
jgi:hypothetical protein